MEHNYEVRFAKSGRETPPTMDERIASHVWRPGSSASRTLKAHRCTGWVGTRTGGAWAYVVWIWEGLR